MKNKFVKELPDNWEIEDFKVTGNYKIEAVIKHKEDNAKILVRPYISYEYQPGFNDSHQVVLMMKGGIKKKEQGLPNLEHSYQVTEKVMEWIERYNNGEFNEQS